MKNIKKLSAIIAVSTILSSSAYADSSFVAVGLNLSTTGLGVEARSPIAQNIFGRVGINYAKVSKSFTDGPIVQEGDVTLLSAPIMVDWHPFDRSGFRLSAGVAYNGNKVKAKASPVRGVTLGGRFFTPVEIGSITAEITLGNAIAGVLSLGYDSSFIGSGPLSFHFEAGAMYSGKPKLSITSTGIAKADFERIYRADAEKTFNDIEKYLKFYPIIKVGLKYAL
jgi:hypothetical protein